MKQVILLAGLIALLSCQVEAPTKEPMSLEIFTNKHNPVFKELDPSKPILKFDSWEEADKFFETLDKQINGTSDTKGIPGEVEMYIDAFPLWYWDDGYVSSDSVRSKSKIYYGCKNIIADIVGDVLFQSFKITQKNYKIAEDKKSLRVSCKGKYEIQTNIHNIGSVTSKICTRTRVWDQQEWPHYTKTLTTDFYPNTPTAQPPLKPIKKPKKTVKKTIKKKPKKKVYKKVGKKTPLKKKKKT